MTKPQTLFKLKFFQKNNLITKINKKLGKT